MMNIVIVAHKFLAQPDDDLVVYLNNNHCANVMHIRHSFSDAPDRCSFYTWYKAGQIYQEYKTNHYRGLNEACVYLKEFFFTLKWIVRSHVSWDAYIGMDGLCVWWGNVLRSIGFVKKTVYWAIDFVPESRFKAPLKNKIYNWVNVRGYRKSDEMWDLSPRMASAREKYLGIGINDYKLHKVVPHGAWTKRIKKYRYDECEKHTLVFIGHLIEKQGVQLVIRAIPEIVKKMPDFRFKIIGDGHYKDKLVALANDLGVISYCIFREKTNDHLKLENEVAKSCLAIAPYIKALDTWTYFADPSKVKIYLACGVPVLLTDVPWNARDIEENKCGKIISERQDDIVSSISEFMIGTLNQAARERAREYACRFDYESIFKCLVI